MEFNINSVDGNKKGIDLDKFFQNIGSVHCFVFENNKYSLN